MFDRRLGDTNEGLGEPKKLGVTEVFDDGKKYIGTVSRFGQELIRIEADIVGPGPDDLSSGPMDNLHFKYSIKADGSGLEPVHLIDSHFENIATDPVLMENCMNKGKLTANQMALQGALFDLKAQIAYKLQDLEFQTDDMIAFRQELIKDMVCKVRELNKENFAVRQHLKYVELYSDPDNYVSLSYEDTLMIKEELAPLITPRCRRSQSHAF